MKPKYTYGDVVSFNIKHGSKNYTLKGSIETIDENGIFSDGSQVYYDIMVDESPFGKCLFKHIREKSII